MWIWRITGADYVDSAFSGAGAADHPGRWNHRGRLVGYASDSPALAMLEVLANAETFAALKDRFIVRTMISDELVYELPDQDLPADWRVYPIPSSTRDLGESWLLDGVYPALSVPSAVMPLQRNILLNSEHEELGDIEVSDVVPLDFDIRLTEFGRG
ncbi:MAG TPA: RES family NAD+ phosphorylase [Trueperaceae bacterium]